jgi:hypothetical protein
MAEKGKYGSIMEEIQKEQQAAPTIVLPVLLPEKRRINTGKRSDPDYKPRGVFLKKETVAHAEDRLKRRGDDTDFSDLVQALLDAWLSTP